MDNDDSLSASPSKGALSENFRDYTHTVNLLNQHIFRLSGFGNSTVERHGKAAAESGASYWCFVRVCASTPIIPNMARGWESKSVEAQQAEATDRSGKPHARLSPEEAARAREREGIRLSRQQVLQQIESARNPKHRKLLEEALSDLDRKSQALG